MIALDHVVTSLWTVQGWRLSSSGDGSPNHARHSRGARSWPRLPQRLGPGGGNLVRRRDLRPELAGLGRRLLEQLFRRLFQAGWVGSPPSHITLARYVVQWNVMSDNYPEYRAEFEAWLTDIASIGLTPDVALTSYTGEYPSSLREYQAQLEKILARAEAIGHPIRYLEAWNEPNNQGDEPAVDAAHFTNSASATCEQGYGCTTVAGNFEDNPNVSTYEEEYIKNLNPIPSIWGVHPYYSVEEMSEAPFLSFREHLPNKGAGEQIWFTEIAARKCTDFAGHEVENGELGQAERAAWLVNTLMRDAKPEHVFYYEFLLGERRQPSCTSEGADGALYVPCTDGGAPDRPRPAAGYV